MQIKIIKQKWTAEVKIPGPIVESADLFPVKTNQDPIMDQNHPKFSLELRMPVFPPKIPCPGCGKIGLKLKVAHKNKVHGILKFCSEACRNAWIYRQQQTE